MHGTINWQVHELMQKSGLLSIGESKHGAKADVREAIVAAGLPATAANIAKFTGVYSYRTADAYRDVWRYAGEYAKAEFGVKNLEKLEPEHIQSYLYAKIDEGLAHATMLQYAAALEKLEVALNRYAEFKNSGRTYSFSSSIATARDRGHQILERHHTNRAYDRPAKLIAAIERPDHQLAAKIQLESGARLRETNMITERNLRGMSHDSVTGRAAGVVEIQGKGGKIGEKLLSPETYHRLESHIAQSPTGRFEIGLSAYRASIATAAAATGQDNQGSHGLRYNYAQGRLQECIRAGQSYTEALYTVSHDMGHERADITLHYVAV